MNKLNKIGVSALCGTLAGISAVNAGDLTVSGGADMTWMSKSDAVTGNPIGIGSNYTLTGSGDLDNGWNVALSIAMTNANAYSNTNVTIGIPGLGDVRIDQGVSGTGIQRYDDLTPTVWEEADGAGLSAGIRKIGGVAGGPNVQVSNLEAVPSGLNLVFAFSPDADSASTTGDKATGGDSGVLGQGWDITAEAGSELHGVDGLTLYGGMSQIDKFQNGATHNGDTDETMYGIKYAMGGFTVGYMRTDEDTGETGSTEYENTMYGITFNVNDDLSVGYAHIDSDEKGAGKATPEADSIQIAYTMGGATFRVAEVDVSNQGYSSATTADLDATVISLGLAF